LILAGNNWVLGASGFAGRGESTTTTPSPTTGSCAAHIWRSSARLTGWSRRSPR